MTDMEVLRTTRFKTPLGNLRIVSSEKGLVYIELPNESGRGFEGWKKTHARDAKVVEARVTPKANNTSGATRSDDSHDPHSLAIAELAEFMSGERREFTMDLDMRATAFQLAVYKFVGKIKYGETVSYSDIADAIGNSKAVRAVGAANGANPIPLVIPCHRVIARGGALQGYAGGLKLKARLLAMESAHSELTPAQERLF
jgi:O-6-methylguanine DNA methyltransferase